MRKLWIAICCLLLSLSCSANHEDAPVAAGQTQTQKLAPTDTADTPVRTLVIPNISATDEPQHEDYYFSRLLDLALQKTLSSHGPYQIVHAKTRTADHRLIASLLQGEVDVLWAATNAEKEQYLLPVRISLLKDLSSYRLLLIRPSDQPRFSAVNSLEDLRQFRGGMNPQWTDAAIMEHNGLPLVYGVEYSQLFQMLSGGRFDYFSRGLYQVKAELHKFPQLKLNMAIEEELMLHYRNDFYFFTHKDDPALAERLQKGLELALEDGSFDALFNSIPRYRWGMEQLQLNQRRVIPLNNLP